MYNKYMSLRAWISAVTLGLIVLILVFSRHELLQAWQLLERVNIWILLLLIPVQLIAYYAAAETLFEYLRSKKSIGHISRPDLMRMALEMNFVNHTLPSGGVSGISYMSWRLGKAGISAGKATSALIIRQVVGFVASIILVAVCVIAVTIDGEINRWIILVSLSIVSIMTTGTVAMMFLLSSKRHVRQFSSWLASSVNRLVKKITRGKKRKVVEEARVLHFFEEMHEDYIDLRKDLKILVKPLWWAILFTIAEGSLFWITFWALGTPVNPAPIFIAYVLASVAGFIVITPGGAGAYEAIMVAFLAVAGIASGTAIAAIILTRVVILVTIIGLGYVFYQQALIKYGKKDQPPL